MGSGGSRVRGRRTWRPLAGLLPGPGACWAGRVDCVRDHTLRGTLLARWEAGYQEGWLVVTDLPPQQAEIAWSGLRAWIECGFKDLQRDGWQWQRTRMSAPERAQRFWRVLAVATLWGVSTGSAAEDALPAATSTKRATPRALSGCRRGVLTRLTDLSTGRPLPAARFAPEPWPRSVGHKTYP